MAKLTSNGVTIVGTPEELAEIMKRFTVEADDVESDIPEFKEGDEVRVNADGEYEDVLSGAYGVVNEILEGDDADGEDGYVIQVLSEGTTDWFRVGGLELAVDDGVLHTFSEGDSVIVLSAGEFGGIGVGETGTVAIGFADDGDEYSIRVDGDGDHDYFRPQDIELVAEEPAPCPFAQFGAGDKVRLLSGGGEHPLSGYDNGSVYEVVVNNAMTGWGADTRTIRLKGGRVCQAFATPDQLEKVTDADAAQAKAERKRSDVFTANGRKVNEYREGDIVKVIRCTTGHTVGTIGEVSDSETHHYPQVFAPYEKTGERMSLHSYVEPITFVENRLDRK